MSEEIPGIRIAETGTGPAPIEGVPTSTAALLGECGIGTYESTLVTSFADYQREFGPDGPYLPDAVRGFFENGGRRAFICRLSRDDEAGANLSAEAVSAGLAALAHSDFHEVSLVAAPGLVDAAIQDAVISHCEAHRRFAVLDCERADPRTLDPRSRRASRNAAIYTPWLKVADGYVPPSGHVLGIYARTDAERGVWKAPANETVRGATGLEHAIDDRVQEVLNPRGVNVIRSFPVRGVRLWGTRTLSTDAEWKYVPIRRLFLFLEPSIEEGIRWVVFEANDEPTWQRVKDLVRAFLTDLWRAGALAGTKAEQAFYVACGRETMTQDDILNGRLICEIGVAPIRPAEFVVFRIGQWTREAAS